MSPAWPRFGGADALETALAEQRELVAEAVDAAVLEFESDRASPP